MKKKEAIKELTSLLPGQKSGALSYGKCNCDADTARLEGWHRGLQHALYYIEDIDVEERPIKVDKKSAHQTISAWIKECKEDLRCVPEERADRVCILVGKLDAYKACRALIENMGEERC